MAELSHFMDSGLLSDENLSKIL